MSLTGLSLSDEKYELLSLALKEAGLARQGRITRRSGLSSLPLSFAQQRIWFLDQLEPGNPQYNTPIGARLHGPLNIPVLQRALLEIVRRHEALRTIFPTVEGRPVQVVLPEIDLPLPIVDLTHVPRAERDTRAQAITDEEGAKPFDLAVGPLTRVALLRLDVDEHWLLLLTHHMIFDGWSVGLFARELAALYEAFATGKPSPLPELPIQYADFAVWQRERLQGKYLQEQIDYWKKKVDGAPEVLKLPTDHPRPAVQRFRGRIQTFAFPPELAKSLNELVRREKTTMFVVLMSAFQILLYRYSGQNDMLVSAGIANRNRSEVESLIGCFINILLLRADLSGDPSFIELLHRVHDSALEAHAHQDLPFEQLVAALRPQRDLSYSPLVQVMMVLHNAVMPGLGFHDITLGRIRQPEKMAAQYDLLIHFSEGPKGIVGRIEYNSDLFYSSTIDRMIDNLETLLYSAAEAPDTNVSSLRLMTEQERQQVVAGNNVTEKEFPRSRCLHQLFEEQAERQPRAVAVIVGDQQLSYGDLNRHANLLARQLRQAGVRPGTVVAICLHRSVELVIGLIAILKAGGAYLPLDPDYPSDRLALMLSDSGANVIITQPQFVASLSAHHGKIIFLEHDWRGIHEEAVENVESGVTPEDLAYLIYTSGSTGRPKGAMLNHRGRVNNFFDFNGRFQIGPGDRLIALSSPSFDMCAYDVFGTLSAGAAIVMPERSVDRDPRHWAELMIAHRVSIWHSVPSLLELLVDAASTLSGKAPLSNLRVALLGGDWIPVTLPDRIRTIAPRAQVISLGGATEVSMDSTIYPIGAIDPSWTSIPYGKPMKNQLAYVVDSRFEAVPIGVSGELCLGGVGVGYGYHSRPDLTAEKFIPHPFGRSGERVYRTGDLARWLPDGNLELIGRIDHQVKVRGFRIELGEIRTALERHPAIKEAEVLMVGSNAEAKKLVGYIVPYSEAPSTNELQAFLKSILPAYMVPGIFMSLETLPLSPNGKIDRRALPVPDLTRDAAVMPSESANATEAEIKRIWIEVLGIENIGVEDDFFELGGDSFQGITILQRLPKRVSLVDFLKTPTVRGLAHCCSLQESGGSSLLLPLTKSPRKGAPVIVCIPYGGGSAIIYQPLANALGHQVDLRAVMLPGHDVEQRQPELKSIAETASLCVEEIKKHVAGPLYLYGHCAGSALTIEVARLLEQEKINIKGIFMGGAYPWYAGVATKILRQLGVGRRLSSEGDIFRFIKQLGGTGENGKTASLDFLAGAFQHDGRCAEEYFKSFREGWPEGRIQAPIVCILAKDDPLTPAYQTRFRRWEAFSPSVELVLLEKGGHYFVKGEAELLAGIVAARCR